MSFWQTLTFIARHPLSKSNRVKNFVAFARWQIGARLVPGPVAFPFVGKTRLFAEPSMTAATGHVYVGLQEFEDMAFVLHALRPDDCFGDIGANIGAYTVLAGGVVGARVTAFEPGATAREWMERNVALNQISDRVEIHSEAVGGASGTLRFSISGDTTNAVIPISAADVGNHVTVPVTTLDAAFAEACPAILKIDVEGYETEVVRGGRRLLREAGLMAVVMEFNGSGAKYGYDELTLRSELREFGFSPFIYAPFERRLKPLINEQERVTDNIIFARSLDVLAARLRDAPSFTVREWKI